MTINPFASRLRAATWDDHSSAEQSDFLADLTKGRLTVEAHIALTAQHYFIYAALEDAATTTDSPFHSSALTRLPSLEADLEHLAGAGWRDRYQKVPATEEYVARLEEIAYTWPGGFVAHHYNRYLGDLSGGQFVARAIAKAYGLTRGEPGLLFYSFPQIADPQAFKAEYRSRLDSASWDELEQGRIVDEVKLAYRLNIDVLSDLGRIYHFSADVIAQIMRHMNEDHAEDSLLIARTLGGKPSATAAAMTGMDADGIDFAVTADHLTTRVRVLFGRRLTERPQVRVEVTRLYQEALQWETVSRGDRS